MIDDLTACAMSDIYPYCCSKRSSILICISIVVRLIHDFVRITCDQFDSIWRARKRAFLVYHLFTKVLVPFERLAVHLSRALRSGLRPQQQTRFHDL